VVGFTGQHNESDHSAVSVRVADLADASAIAAVHVAGWEGAYRGMVPHAEINRRTVAWRTEMWEAILQATVDGSRPWVAVAERDGPIIGFVSMGAPRGADRDGSEARGQGVARRTLEITGLYVTPTAWRHGAGTALMRAALAEASARGCDDVTLWVLEPNDRARVFYERFGFSDDGARQRDGEGWPVELRMRRSI